MSWPVQCVATRSDIPGGKRPASGSRHRFVAQNAVVKKYLDGCRAKLSKEANCDTLKKEAVEILKEDLHTLGSSADRTYIPFILTIFKSDELNCAWLPPAR